MLSMRPTGTSGCRGRTDFAAYTGASPLRHAWSLAVEEQFYLLWPVVLWGLVSLGGRLRGRLAGRRLATACVVAGIVVSTVALASVWTPGDPSRAYYGTDGRVQELFTGALLALAVPAPRVDLPVIVLVGAAGRRRAVGGRRGARAAAAHAGHLRHDRGGALRCSASSLPRALADVELRPAGWAARLLSWRPAVALGVISYGVYLWHWPIIVAWPLPGDPLPAAAVQAGRVLLMVAGGRGVLPAGGALGAAGPAPLGGRAPAAGCPQCRGRGRCGAAGRCPRDGAPDRRRRPAGGPLGSPCPTEQHDPYAYCTKTQGPPGAATIALVGDSTARAFDPGLREVAARRWLELRAGRMGALLGHRAAGRAARAAGGEPGRPRLP